eukprot:2341004-Prorocentrum_lima.AAC.1
MFTSMSFTEINRSTAPVRLGALMNKNECRFAELPSSPHPPLVRSTELLLLCGVEKRKSERGCGQSR